MVLSLAAEDTGAVATRSPLFVGDVLIDAGAEYSPLLPLNSHLFLKPLKFPENEYGCRRRWRFSLLLLRNNKNGRTNLAYLFNKSNLIFFFVCFSLSSSSRAFGDFPKPNKEKDLIFFLDFVSVSTRFVLVSTTLLLSPPGF